MFSLKGLVGREWAVLSKRKSDLSWVLEQGSLTPGENKQGGVASVFEGSQDKGIHSLGSYYEWFISVHSACSPLLESLISISWGKIIVLDLKIFCSPYGLEVNNSEMALA